MIPKKIFQTWKSKTEIPDNFQYWQRTMKVCNPDYRYELFDDDDNRDFIQKNFPWFLPTYESYPKEIYRADAIRYFRLFVGGGIYADMDTECLSPLDDLVNVDGVVLGQMGTDTDLDSCIPNAIMFSAPREEFWLLVISMMMSENPNSRPEIATGPNLLRRAFLRYHNDYQGDSVQMRIAEIRVKLKEYQADTRKKSAITILPGKYLYPLNWDDQVHDRLLRRPLLREKQILSREAAVKMFPGSFTVTYWTHTWEPCDIS